MIEFITITHRNTAISLGKKSVKNDTIMKYSRNLIGV